MSVLEEVKHILNEWHLDFLHIGMRAEANVYRAIASFLVRFSQGKETAKELHIISNFLAACRTEFDQSSNDELDFIASCISHDVATHVRKIRRERFYVYSVKKDIYQHRATMQLEDILGEYV